jgi:hypothetical protein
MCFTSPLSNTTVLILMTYSLLSMINHSTAFFFVSFYFIGGKNVVSSNE